jgi:hypothetical protein
MIQAVEASGDSTKDSADPNAPAPVVMSNPLITIENISLTDNITVANQGEMNEGQVVLRFYVR